MIREALEKVVTFRDLSESEMAVVMEEIMDGAVTPAQTGSFVTGLRMKGETVSELTGAARMMRQQAIMIDARSSRVLDTCGTGGDGSHTFNISTTVALVAAGAGVTVAKHGNRSVSSQCGSADLLEELGVNINVAPDMVEECVKEAGIGFLFAPLLHRAMRHVANPRRELGIRTIFNLLGPLTNPAGATCQLLGVYDATLTEIFASALRNLGTKRALVVHGSDGLDEITLCGETRVTELSGGRLRTYNLNGGELFGRSYSPEDFQGGDARTNARITGAILAGERGPKRDIVVINASAALVVSGAAKDLAEGIALAEAVIDQGLAARKLDHVIALTNS